MPTSSLSPRVTRRSVCALQWVEDKEAEQHSIGNHTAHITKLVEQLTVKHEVGSLDPSWCTLLFFENTF